VKSKENARERILAAWGSWASRNWGKTLLIALALTLIMIIGVSRLHLEMTFFSVMPGSSTQVQDMKRIMAEFPFASSITVVVDGRMIEDRDKAEQTVKATVDSLVKEFSREEHAEYVADVFGRVDMEFFKKHGLILNKPEDIRRFGRMYEDLNLVPLFSSFNDDFEREYSGNEEALEDDEDLAVAQFRGFGDIFSLLEKAVSEDASGGG